MQANKRLQSGFKKLKNLKNFSFSDECDEEYYEQNENMQSKSVKDDVCTRKFKLDFDELSFHESLVSKANSEIGQTLNNKFFKIKRTKSESKRSKLRL